MVDPDDGALPDLRAPLLEDLLKTCRALNDAGAKCVIVGGVAVKQAGFVRGTEGIDLLVHSSPTSIERTREALSVLPDQAVREARPTDLDEYVVERVGDRVVVDLMKSACGVDDAEAQDSTEKAAIGGVEVPFASPELLRPGRTRVRGALPLAAFGG